MNTEARPVVEIQFIDENTGWASTVGGQTFITAGNFFKTTNSGQDWIMLRSGFYSYPDFQFINQNTGWLLSIIMSTDDSYGRCDILRSTDGGYTWNDTFSVPSLYSFHFVNENVGWASGSYGILYKTMNGGLNWVQVRDSVDNTFDNRIFFLNEQTGFLTARDKILRTTNAGINWNVVFNDNNDYSFTNFNLVNSNSVWISASFQVSSCVFRTTDIGESWQRIIVNSNNNTYYSKNYVFMTTENNGYYSIGVENATYTRVYRTTNSGINWSVLSYLQTDPARSMYFINDNTGWLGAGVSINTFGRALIYKTTNGGNPIGIIPINSNIPKVFKLQQNYPNPFNPATRIKFDLPKSSFVKLIVHDAVGRETEKIIDEELSAGSYEAEWNASEYPSGIYFYKLSAGNYSETRKMVLIK